MTRFNRRSSVQLHSSLLICIIICVSVCNCDKAKGQDTESRFLNSEEEPGILLPPDDKYNFVGQDDPTVSNVDIWWRSGRSPLTSVTPPDSTISSTNSYKIRDSHQGTGSSVFVHPKPVSMTTTGSGNSNGEKYVVKSGTASNFNSNPYSTYPPFPSRNSESKTNNDKPTTIFVKNNCFGPRCPDSNQNLSDDDWKSYHYILNKDAKQKYKRLYNFGNFGDFGNFGNFHDSNSKYLNTFNQKKEFGSYSKVQTDTPAINRRMGTASEDSGESDTTKRLSLSIPFVVERPKSKYDSVFPNHRLNRRVQRTTTTTTTGRSQGTFSTTTPAWIKLQPILPTDHYDPFTLKKTLSSSSDKPSFPTPSQFANRLGMELDPDSFAERWGWGGSDQDRISGGGSRLPQWLQDMHKSGPAVSNNRNDDNRNWVKLDPIPITKVAISKWVPKGTPSHELPSTNWPDRDRPNSQGIPNAILNPGNYEHQQGPTRNQGTKWWDIIDNINKSKRPPSYPPNLDAGWGSGGHNSNSNSNYNKQSTTSGWDRDRDRSPTNSWGDIIYPEGPNSATVSWQQDKDMSKYPSSFSTSTSSPSNYYQHNNNDNRRPTGSWSADRNDPYSQGNRRYGSSYPDRHTSEDDPRWVLVSNSRKVTINSDYGGGGGGGQKYRPQFDYPYEPPYHYNNHRVGKDYKNFIHKGVTNFTVVKKTGSAAQDTAFFKVNATLSNLTPVLNRRGQKSPAFTKPYAGDARTTTKNSTRDKDAIVIDSDNLMSASGTVAQRFRKGVQGVSINPVYAAVGAGMIPATMAAVLPMVLGRRRRRDLMRMKRSQGHLDELQPELLPVLLEQTDHYHPEDSGSMVDPRVDSGSKMLTKLIQRGSHDRQIDRRYL